MYLHNITGICQLKHEIIQLWYHSTVLGINSLDYSLAILSAAIVAASRQYFRYGRFRQTVLLGFQYRARLSQEANIYSEMMRADVV